jgi:hypothetical protein
MFYNPGGPGASGIGFLAHTGPLLQAQIGNTWDVLSWDPRTFDFSDSISNIRSFPVYSSGHTFASFLLESCV